MTTNIEVSEQPDERSAGTPGARNRWILAGAAAAIVVVASVAVALSGGDDGERDVAAGPPVELSLGADDTMASCLPVDAKFLADMPTAFAGTATEVADDVVTLEVEHWYTDGDAATVELHAQSGQTALIAGFDFEVGERYLVSATDGSVNLCGFSGRATPELSALFDEAFAGG